MPTRPVRVGAREVRFELTPHYLTERDHPWISRYYDEFLRFKGKRRRELRSFFGGGLAFQFPEKKGALLFHLLSSESEDDGGRGVAKKARALRVALFETAARSAVVKPEPSGILSDPEIARVLSGLVDPIEAAFSDLPLERRIVRMPEGWAPQRLALLANSRLAQSFVGRSSWVEIVAEGDLRRVVRQAKLHRLICEVTEIPAGARSVLRLSGPLSLFGHTTAYGRALSQLVPLLAWCNRFELRALARVRGRDAVFRLRSGDPIAPSQEPRRFDSLLERRFAQEFGRLAPDWELVREPGAFPLRDEAGSMIFPDFLIRHRRNPAVFFYLEIVGYWTEDYLARKLNGLLKARISNLILCIDESLDCGEGWDRKRLDCLGRVIFYRKRIPCAEVIAAMKRGADPGVATG